MLNRKVAEVKAVDDVSFTVLKGETLGVVGKSGCGKSTLARLLMHLLHARTPANWSSTATRSGRPTGMPLRELRRNMQMVFQDSYSSLNPRLPVEESIAYRAACARHGVAPRQSAWPATCCSASGCGRNFSAAAIRTNCPAARSSASTSPARWR